ncbi:MAG: hypothetical protein JWP71_1945 [Mucilaginibacter sp.]|nr:hypothetical protein [Mucilaginibacter sp.]
MEETKFKVGKRVRHNSTKDAPSMVIIEIKDKVNIFGNLHCRYWQNDEFVTKSFIESELNLLADVQP